MRDREFDRSRTIDQKKRPVRLTANGAPHRPGISRGARFARTQVMTFFTISQTARTPQVEFHVVSHFVWFAGSANFAIAGT